MIRIEGEIAIDQPVGEVFDFVADERNEPRYNPRILRVQKLTPGPIGQGTRFRAETTTMGRTAGIAIEYTAYQRPRRLGSSIHMAAADIQGTLTFDPAAAGTRMGWTWDVRLQGWYRLLRPIIGWTGRRQEQATGPASSGSWKANGTGCQTHAEVLLSRQLLGWIDRLLPARCRAQSTAAVVRDGHAVAEAAATAPVCSLRRGPSRRLI